MSAGNGAVPLDAVTLARPDDWHLHLRDADALGDLVSATAGVFARAIVMPNLRTPVRTQTDAEAYQRRILDACPPGVAPAP